ncbi:MAG: response regulator [Gammaproteobacteria bacterium]|jgi:signal transduction histidine kinase/CheY-like chemotaxis protein|nr:response regulator [Gammaproteobacteria bacterium]MBQ0775710.1 response regulator [Gammaproteobacteria bacterium]
MIAKFRRFHAENPLAFRLMGAILLVSSIITLVAILLLLAREYDIGLSDIEEDLEQVELTTLPGIERSLWNFDEEQLRVQLEGLLRLPEVSGAEVQWQDWNSQTRHLRVGEEIVAVSGNRAHSYPIIYRRRDGSAEELGVLHIQVSRDALYQRVGEHAAFIVLFQLVKTLIIAVIIIFLLRHLLGRHLRTIAEYAREMSISRLHSPLRLARYQQSRDELQDISDAINEMRESLREDIHQREKAEVALLKEQEQNLKSEEKRIRAESASVAKTEFLATMSHEIRTPMNGIVGVLDLLANSPLNDRQQHYLKLMQHSGENLLAILNDILDFSKIEAGQLQLETATVDVQALVEDSVSAFAGVARQQSLQLVMDIRLDSMRWVYGDPVRLRQTLLNLVNNALKFTREGHVVVRAYEKSVSGSRDCLRIDVEDTGVGIAAAQIERIFAVFTQADQSTSRHFGGTGLGLAVSKRLTELMGGKIGVDSEPGKGSRFWLELPLPRYHADQAHIPQQTNRQVLLLSPTQVESDAIEHMLTHLGATVTSASDLSHLEMASRYEHLLIDFLLLQNASKEDADLLRRCKDKVTIIASIDSNADAWNSIPKPVTPSSLRTLLQFKQEQTPGKTKQHISQHARFDHLSVLVAEDNDVNRDVIRAILGALKIQPVLCKNGEEATAAYRAAGGAFDLVLMDCEMPVMDGITATQRIRDIEKQASLENTPIVALTAHVLQEQRQRMLDAGMDHFLSKPVRKDSVQKLLTDLGLEKHLQVVSFDGRREN